MGRFVITDKDKEIKRVSDFCKFAKDIIPEKMFLWMINNDFFVAPASSKYHGAYEGGLYEHSIHVMELLKEYEKSGLFQFIDSRSATIIGLLHDICKIDLYAQNEQGYIYQNDSLYKGHGSKSIELISQFMTLTEEEILCIRYHMGAYKQMNGICLTGQSENIPPCYGHIRLIWLPAN